MSDTPKRLITHAELLAAAAPIATKLAEIAVRNNGFVYVYPVPRGGVPVFYLVEGLFNALPINQTKTRLNIRMVEGPHVANVILDDLIDSGGTEERYAEHKLPFYALFKKQEFATPPDGTTPFWMPKNQWRVFPWEASEEKSIDDAFVRLLQYVGEDPLRGGLLETPHRMAKAWKDWTSGYGVDAKAILKTFEDGGENYDEMVHVKNIPFYSHCEHHLAPFFGTVTFAYVPSKRIVGLSKMNRLVDAFGRRLQVQERLTSQIIDSFCEELAPMGAGIIIRARHMCVESRGVNQQGSSTTTSAFRGVLKEKPEARQEFLLLAQ